jgi:tetratricopeptide (TPR) repeat protein
MRTPTRVNWNLVAATFLLFLNPISFAQNSTVQGTVHDSANHPMAAVAVSLQTGNRSQPLTAHTDAQGSYRFSNLIPGSYVVHAEVLGFAAKDAGPFPLADHESKQIDLTLEPSQFFDPPQFTVAGVTDASGTGGHGSEAIIRTTDGMVKSALSLGNNPEPAPVNAATEQALRDAIAHSPRDPKAYEMLADIEEKSGRSLEAARDYQRAAELDPSEPDLFAWGAELLLHHAAEPAIEVFAKGDRQYPQSARMLIGLGVAEYSRGFYEQATHHLCQASDLNPNDPAPYLFLGKMQSVAASRSESVDERLKRFLQLQPANALANYYYAMSLWYQPDRTDGIAKQIETALRKAVELDPHLGIAHLQLGIVLAESNNVNGAIASYQKAIASAPDLEAAYYRLAQAYKVTGQTAKAHDEFELFEEIRKNNAAQSDRERHEIQQFVYTLRDSNPGTQPQ